MRESGVVDTPLPAPSPCGGICATRVKCKPASLAMPRVERPGSLRLFERLAPSLAERFELVLRRIEIEACARRTDSEPWLVDLPPSPWTPIGLSDETRMRPRRRGTLRKRPEDSGTQKQGETDDPALHRETLGVPRNSEERARQDLNL